MENEGNISAPTTSKLGKFLSIRNVARASISEQPMSSRARNDAFY